MQGVQPLDRGLGLGPSSPSFPAAVGGLSHKECQSNLGVIAPRQKHQETDDG